MSYAEAIINYSNVTPFRTYPGATFHCYFACQKILAPDPFREHNREAHAKDRPRIISGLPESIIKVDVEGLSCTLCNERMSGLPTLETHLKLAHGKHFKKDLRRDIIVPFKLTTGMYQCQICDQTFPDLRRTDYHMNAHFSRYICESCGVGFLSKIRLKSHVLTHTRGVFPCKVCHKVFSSSQKLRCHTAVKHNGVARRSCRLCPAKFKEHYQLKKHMVELHNATPEDLTCKICDKRFNLKHSMKAHIRRDHDQERNHHCYVCGKAFYQSARLKEHMVTHTGVRAFRCEICNKSYGTKPTLNKHVKLHKQIACHLCAQHFEHKTALKDHMSSNHAELKTYP